MLKRKERKSPKRKHPEVKKITEHVPKHKKPINKNEIGDYLAGILENNGKITKKGINIILNSNRH